jgi:hypothetical protein
MGPAMKRKSILLPWLVGLGGTWLGLFLTIAVISVFKGPFMEGKPLLSQVIAMLLVSIVMGTGLWGMFVLSHLYVVLCDFRHSRCPKCNRAFAGSEIDSSTFVIGQTDVAVPTQRAVRNTPFGKPIAYVDDSTTVRMNVNKSCRLWQCRFCDHQWESSEVCV